MLRKFISLFSRLEIHSQPISMVVLEVLLPAEKFDHQGGIQKWVSEDRGNLWFLKLFEIIVVCNIGI